MGDVRGTLYVASTTGPGPVREEQIAFDDLQQLLDACVGQGEASAFLRVEIVGKSGGERMRLVLDFGQFGRDEG
jgi:hypothetical protein